MALEPFGVKARLEDDLAELRRSLSGTVVEPADSEYDAARRCFNAPHEQLLPFVQRLRDIRVLDFAQAVCLVCLLREVFGDCA